MLRLLTALLLILTASCATDVASRYYGNVHYPPKNPADVQVLHHKPSRDFIVIADFQSRGETAQDMQEKAARIGADAVIISILGGLYDRREEWADEDRYKNTYSRITATAIKYKE